MEKYNTIKIALVGAAFSGKSCLAKAITKQSLFNRDYIPTIGSDLCHMYIPQDSLKILFWDLSGIDRFSFLIESYISTSHLVCLCYDSDDFNSYQKLKEKYVALREFIKDKPVCVVSTKNDRNTYDEYWGKELSTQLGCPYFTTSSLRGNTKELLDWILEETWKKYPRYIEIEDGNDFPKKKCCCFSLQPI